MRRHLTYANVMATVAVFVALGGTATAAIVITGKNVKNGTITSADIKNGTIKAADVKRGGLKARNFKRGSLPRGAVGPVGPAGAPGAAGANGTDATTVGWARVVRPRTSQPDGSVLTGAWGAPIAKNLVAVAGSKAAPGLEADTTVCLQFATPPNGVVAMGTDATQTLSGGVDPTTAKARCESALPTANAYVYGAGSNGEALTAFDAFVGAY